MNKTEVKITTFRLGALKLTYVTTVAQNTVIFYACTR